jgi:hypothetical protein
MKTTSMQPWEIPLSDREDGVECLAFHRGKWVHVKWRPLHKGWSLGYQKAFLPDGIERAFAPLPLHPNASPDFFGWK